MNIASYEISRKELAGALGDLGTLIPLVIGYIFVCGLNPAGVLVMLGLANIAIGLVYKLPLPLQPMKVIAAVAIAQQWTPSMIYAAGFGMGIVWLFMGATNVMQWVARATPHPVTRGIQVALGVLLAIKAGKMILPQWHIGLLSCGVVILLRKNRYAPASLVLLLIGAVMTALSGRLHGLGAFTVSLPTLTGFAPADLWPSLLQAGFAQIPLTATNAVIATTALITAYWPDRRPVNPRALSWSMGMINIIFPFFGGMPLCHGAGGLAAQYYFGARTGGAKLIEGGIQIIAGLVLAGFILRLFTAFPAAIIGAMMLVVGIELAKFGKDVGLNKDLAPFAVTVIGACLTKMACGFLLGMLIHYGLCFLKKTKSTSAPPNTP